MNIFSNDSFFVVVDEGGDIPAFVVFTASGGYKTTDTLLEASKYVEKGNAITAANRADNFSVYQVSLKSHVGGSHAFSEKWKWEKVT